MALMLMVDEVIKGLDNGGCVIGIFLDFSKGFATANHSILIEKLYHYQSKKLFVLLKKAL